MPIMLCRVADEIDPGDNCGIEIRVHGILERRHEQTHAVRAHLMHVVDDLRKPFLVQHAGDEPCLDLRQHEPVAIVVMADVLVIEPGQGPALVPRPLVAAIPAHDRVEAVGVHRRDHQHDHRVEQTAQFRIGHQPVGECHAHLARRHFGRMDVVADQNDGRLTGADVCQRRIGEPPRIREERLRLLDLCEALLIGGGRDRQQQERTAFRRATERVHTHVAAALREPVHVAADLLPIGEHGIGAGLELEVVGRFDGRTVGL